MKYFSKIFTQRNEFIVPEIANNGEIRDLLSNLKGIIVDHQKTEDGTLDVVLSSTKEILKIYYNKEGEPHKIRIYGSIIDFHEASKVSRAAKRKFFRKAS